MVKVLTRKKITINSSYLQHNLNNVLKIVAILTMSYNVVRKGPLINTISQELKHQNLDDSCNINPETHACYIFRRLLSSISFSHAYMALQKKKKENVFRYLVYINNTSLFPRHLWDTSSLSSVTAINLQTVTSLCNIPMATE